MFTTFLSNGLEENTAPIQKRTTCVTTASGMISPLIVHVSDRYLSTISLSRGKIYDTFGRNVTIATMVPYVLSPP